MLDIDLNTIKVLAELHEVPVEQMMIAYATITVMEDKFDVFITKADLIDEILGEVFKV